MWDEDNNPYGTSFDRRDSQTSSSVNPASPSASKFGSLFDAQLLFEDAVSLYILHHKCKCPDVRLGRGFEAPQTPTSGSDDEVPAFSHRLDAGRGDEHDQHEEPAQVQPARKPGRYTSRIEQILYENPKMQIAITDAGKSLESGGRHIVYTIRTGVCIDMY